MLVPSLEKFEENFYEKLPFKHHDMRNLTRNNRASWENKEYYSEYFIFFILNILISYHLVCCLLLPATLLLTYFVIYYADKF